MDITEMHKPELEFMDGHLLIAMPGMKDPRFERSVIFMCAHSEDGAMGIIINQPTDNVSFSDLMEQLELADELDTVIPEGAIADKTIHVGGPVETSRGFVLHSPDYYVADSTLPIEHGISLTATVEILRAIASDEGPQQSFLALGYAGWAPGQLESELRANGWLHCPADPEIVFSNRFEDKYERALALLGIDPSFLAVDAGHA
jgi:putative transcriptional regulator